MKLSIGIVGLPNVGKSSLFKALTKNDITIANYPFATIDPNVGIVEVPDERIDKLAHMSASKKKIPAIVEFYDIAGLVKGASQGEGLGNQFLAHIRQTDAIAHVIRCFTNEAIIHVDGKPNPIRDLDVLETELVLKDLETVEKRLIKAQSDAQSGDKAKIALRDRLKDLKAKLDAGVPLFTTEQKDEEKELCKELGLLSAKPQLFVLNGNEEDVSEELKQKLTGTRGTYVYIDLGAPEPDLKPLIAKAYALLGLISFFTTGEDETRAWTIVRGWKAPRAAGAIHTDFEEKFIRAEVVYYQDLLEAGGWTQAKQKGLLRTEGKEYVPKDGDVMEIRHG